VNTGTRKAIVVPRTYVYRRAGVDYAKLADGGEAVVQLGESHGARDVEILSGLKDGDRLVQP
jgi:membrane fusion protein, multidrug efflux system